MDRYKRIGRAVALAKVKAPPPPENAVYRYLRAVYEIRPLMKPGMAAKPHAVELAEENDIKPKVRREPFRVLIELTAPAHIKQKQRNKYANALLWAYKNKISPDRLEVSIRGKGGINACDETYRASKNK